MDSTLAEVYANKEKIALLPPFEVSMKYYHSSLAILDLEWLE
jgi:hypothetical protein